jgi:hypothetical protein
MPRMHAMPAVPAGIAPPLDDHAGRQLGSGIGSFAVRHLPRIRCRARADRGTRER